MRTYQRHKSCGGILDHFCNLSYPPQNMYRCMKCGKSWRQPLFYQPPRELDPEEIGYVECEGPA